MKFFHLSDLHIGLKLQNRDLRQDQEYIFGKIAEYAQKEKPDAIVIAGDIYDKAVPSAEAVEVFDRFIQGLAQAAPETVVMMISGNHDSASRVNCFRSVLARQKLYMIGQPPQREGEYIEKVSLYDTWGKVNFYLLPFVKPSTVKAITGCDENGNNLSYNETVCRLIQRENIREEERNVIVSHQFYLPSGTRAEDIPRMDSEIRTVGNIDEVQSSVLEPFDYAALGHIHKPMKVGSEVIRYCGTPFPTSVSEAGQQKGILQVEMGAKGDVCVNVLPLEPLHQVRVIRGTLEEVVKQSCEDYVTVILNDQADLDIMDMQDRLRCAFPGLLEIRRENLRTADYSREVNGELQKDPFELCCSFLKDMDEQERELLKDVINSVKEAH